MPITQSTHQPVLLNEVTECLARVADGIYIDATFGRGGHTRALLQRLSEKGRVIAIDRDPQAYAYAQQAFQDDMRLSVYLGSFAQIAKIAKMYEVFGHVNGILLDLGMSSPQLDDPKRGFSFLQSGPLDMRMNPTEGMSAAEWLAIASRDEIEQILRIYGQEPYAKRLAKAIVNERLVRPICTTDHLTQLIHAVRPYRKQRKHPATLVFQAIRIWINHELDDLKICLRDSLDILACAGRLLIISFHSLEDRIVKQFIRTHSRLPAELARLPMTVSQQPKLRLKPIGSPIKPSLCEVQANPRARSAILRIAEKLI